MRKLILLTILLAVPLVGASPTDFSFLGTWNEIFKNGEGLPGNILSASVSIDSAPLVSISDAISTGAKLPSDPLFAQYEWITNEGLAGMFMGGAEYDYVTKYEDGQYYDSFFDVWFTIDFFNYTDMNFYADKSDPDYPKYYPGFAIYGSGSGTAQLTGKQYSIELFGMGGVSEYTVDGINGWIWGDGTISVPAPGALVLGALGVGLVGMIRRRLA
jgi:hypothetical protein